MSYQTQRSDWLVSSENHAQWRRGSWTLLTGFTQYMEIRGTQIWELGLWMMPNSQFDHYLNVGVVNRT